MLSAITIVMLWMESFMNRPSAPPRPVKTCLELVWLIVFRLMLAKAWLWAKVQFAMWTLGAAVKFAKIELMPMAKPPVFPRNGTGTFPFPVLCSIVQFDRATCWELYMSRDASVKLLQETHMRQWVKCSYLTYNLICIMCKIWNMYKGSLH